MVGRYTRASTHRLGKLNSSSTLAQVKHDTKLALFLRDEGIFPRQIMNYISSESVEGFVLDFLIARSYNKAPTRPYILL